MSLKVFLATVSLLSAPANALAQDRSTILVLDASGSMWAQLPEGRARIEVARDVLSDFLAARDPAQPLGVVAYGHTRSGDCSDIGTIAPVEVQDASALGQRVRAVMPRGKTPLADALRHAASEIPATAEEADIVLVTDGLETCGGDPCAVAAELAAQGIPIRAHVVGFGLTEGEVRQIACVAEETGGMVLATQSGAELSEALLRTATAPTTPAPPGTAAINLAIRADIAGRPDRVAFRAVHEATGETRELGVLDFSMAHHLTVDLAEGSWLITADAGNAGSGEVVAQVVAGENATIYVPFRGLLPRLDMPAPTGAFRAGINGLIPYRILEEGLATGGGDFILSVLPADATSTTDRRIDYATQDSRQGSYVGSFRTPAQPGRYLLVFHRNASMPINEAMARFEITVEARPEVQLIAPPAVAPGERIPVTIAGGMGNGDRIEIWRDGALYSWDQSLYIQDLFDNAYGPARPLLAPSEPGDYELVYVFAELDGAAAVAARLPLSVGAVPDVDEAAAPTDRGDALQQAVASPKPPADGGAMADGRGHACPADHGVPCIFDDAETGLLFAIPPGWFTDRPTRASAVAGDPGTEGQVRVSFFSPAVPDPDTIVLNPHQWTEMNGPCQQVQAGLLCHFTPVTPELARGLEVLGRALRDTRPAPTLPVAAPQDALQQAMADLAREDPAAAAAMAGLLQAAQGRDGGTADPGALPGAAAGRAPQPGEAAGHGPDAAGAGNRAWSDYPHRCLPGDKTVANCDMRDAATNLFFHLPENWVADVTPAEPFPRAEFAEKAGSAQSIWLNPVDWPLGDRGCEITRVGRLCADPDQGDENRARAIRTLQFTLTTGEVLRRCGDEPCVFGFEGAPISGHLPARWSVEVGETLPDGRVATWFWDMDRDGTFKLMGLNQPGGETCWSLQPGDDICEFTADIPPEESAFIINMIVPPAPQHRKPGADASPPRTLSPEAMNALLDLIGSN